MIADRPSTYQDVWDQYAAGKLSTTVLRKLLDEDEVFRAWCMRRVRTERERRQREFENEDMA